MYRLCNRGVAFQRGLKSFYDEDNLKARYWFAYAITNPKLKDKSLAKLIEKS